MTEILRRLGLICMTLTLAVNSAWAMSPPYPRESIAGVQDGRSAPFVGSWAMSMPSDVPGQDGVTYVNCEQPIRIEPADESHIFYLGPKETEADAAIELVATDGSTAWEPIAGGPRHVAVWVALDSFHLHDAEALSEEEWARPFIYLRCD